MREYDRCYEEAYLITALDFYSQAIERDAVYGDAYRKRALVYGLLEEYDRKTDDLNKAIQILENALEQGQAEQELLFNLAMTYRDNHALEHSVEQAWYYFNEVLKMNPGHAQAMFELANILKYEKRDYAAAVAYFSDAIQSNMDNVNFYLERGECFESLKRYHQALGDYDKGISLKPQDWRFYNRRGELYIQLKQWSEARDDYIKFRNFYPYAQHTPVMALQKEVIGGPCIEFYFAENTDQHKPWHPDSWYIEDCIFMEVHKCFAQPFPTFSIYGNFEYSIQDMRQVLDGLIDSLAALNLVCSYADFFSHVVETWFVATLIRDFADFEVHWMEWLEQLKRIHIELISHMCDALACGKRLYLFGV